MTKLGWRHIANLMVTTIVILAAVTIGLAYIR
jgi:hypothetical protein